MEQDASSPHRYFEENEVLENEVVFDCGGAEGNFVLEIIDKIDKAVIFECDQEWVEALKKTFEPFKEKVLIVDKFVGNGMKGTASLDSVAEQFHLYPSIIKMDIEGAEVDALDGIAELMHTASNLKLYVCTYHRADDEDAIISKLSDGFEIQQSKGYMFYKNSFRKAVVRAKLKEN